MITYFRHFVYQIFHLSSEISTSRRHERMPNGIEDLTYNFYFTLLFFFITIYMSYNVT